MNTVGCQDVADGDSSPGGMQFIDFEYSHWCYRGFDLGNHFNEYAGFECEYSRYPDKDHIAFFMRHYLAEGEADEPVSIFLLDHLCNEQW